MGHNSCPPRPLPFPSLAAHALASCPGSVRSLGGVPRPASQRTLWADIAPPSSIFSSRASSLVRYSVPLARAFSITLTYSSPLAFSSPGGQQERARRSVRENARKPAGARAG